VRRSTCFFLALLVVGSAKGALAQDPVKLSPNLYKVVLENDQVRVLEYRVKPGDKEPMHSHPAAVVYVFTDGKAKATTPDGKSQIIENKAGETIWSEPVTHAWEYLGPENGRVLIVELKKLLPPKPAAQKP
jgi:quercetin dioxygenase-like cupin family protein